MEIALGQMSMENEGRYNAMYRPAFQRYVSDIRELGSKRDIGRAGALASAGIVSDMAPKYNEGMRSASIAGAAPNSGALMMGAANGRADMATTMGNAAFGAKMGQRNAYLSGLQNAVGIGKQQSSTAQQSMADVAGLAQDRAEKNIAMDMAQAGGAGSAFGALVGYGLGNYAGRK